MGDWILIPACKIQFETLQAANSRFHSIQTSCFQSHESIHPIFWYNTKIMQCTTQNSQVFPIQIKLVILHFKTLPDHSQSSLIPPLHGQSFRISRVVGLVYGDKPVQQDNAYQSQYSNPVSMLPPKWNDRHCWRRWQLTQRTQRISPGLNIVRYPPAYHEKQPVTSENPCY